MADMQKRHKVAIPKLDRGLPPPPRGPDKNREDRVTRACKTCRRRKVRCSGDVPRCANCQANSLDCIYEQRRRDRLKEATDLNHAFVTIFSELSERLSEDDRKKIQSIIDAAESDIISPYPTPSIRSLGKRARRSSANSGSPDPESPIKKHGEAHVTASVGSNEDLDYLDEDLLRTRESRETGYVGKNSGVQWLRSVQRHAQSNETEPYGLSYGPPGTSEAAFNERSNALHKRRQENHTITRHVTDATFYLDSDNIELDVVVNPYELPDPEIAEQLLNCYMDTVHETFPIVPLSFENQLRRFIDSLKQNRAFQVPDRWRALMNLIFAIGAKYSHLVGTEWQGDEHDHLVFMTRALHLLSMNNTVMFLTGPDLLLVQATAVLSFYFLIIGHVSRAWLMVGISTRLALALGLHLRNEDRSTDTAKKETLQRTWWSLHGIECLASSITGRPPVILNEDCTVPLPRVSPGEQPSASGNFGQPSKKTAHTSSGKSSDASSPVGSGTYFPNTITCSLLTQRVLTELYAPHTAVHSWQDIQGKIKNLLSDLESWSKTSLSGHTTPSSPEQSDVEREQMLLQISYWSSKIMITRPCLCRTERRIKNESDRSAHFNSVMAGTCVDSARALTALFPDKPTLKFAYGKAPWWNVVHIIMQCIAVLLLETANQEGHTEEHVSKITADIKKLMTWLRAMKSNDPVARRAYHVVRKILHNAAPALRHRAEELLDESTANRQVVDDQAFEGFGSTYTQSSDPNWAQGEFFSGISPTTGHHYYPSEQASSQHQGYAPSSSIDQSIYPDFPIEQYRMPSTFGNPFLNSWDEGPPVTDIHNLWLHPSFVGNSLEDLGDMNLLAMTNGPQHYQGANDSSYEHKSQK